MKIVCISALEYSYGMFTLMTYLIISLERLIITKNFQPCANDTNGFMLCTSILCNFQLLYDFQDATV